jgi:hypothetical protein
MAYPYWPACKAEINLGLELKILARIFLGVYPSPKKPKFKYGFFGSTCFNNSEVVKIG